MRKCLSFAGRVAALARGLFVKLRRWPGALRPSTTFRMRCRACRAELLVDTGRRFADPTDAESLPGCVTCPHCRQRHDVHYSPAGALHRSVALPPPRRGHGLWGVRFSHN